MKYTFSRRCCLATARGISVAEGERFKNNRQQRHFCKGTFPQIPDPNSGAFACSFVNNAHVPPSTMAYRIKYLLGIMATLFGLLYMLIGIVGWQERSTVVDRWMPFILASLHIGLATLLFWTSSRERLTEHSRLERLLRLVLRDQVSVSAGQFAELAGISPPEAEEFLRWASRRRHNLVTITEGTTTLRAWARYSLN
jgi:hypothetical protein